MDKTGERIKARRLDAGLAQRLVAESAGISASYLNLIEHGKRPVSGTLLRKLAAAMNVTPDLLAEQADRALLNRIEAAVGLVEQAVVEVGRSDDLVSRFPGWARLIAELADRVVALEDQLRRLSDRITYDPELARALHGVISSVTAIQSTAGILTENEGLDADWRKRFHTNIYNDARKLADTSRALVAYLDAPQDGDRPLSSPMDDRAALLEKTGFYRAGLEGPDAAPPAQGDDLMAHYDRQYAQDAALLPLPLFRRTANRLNWDPLRLSAELGVPLPAILRRLVSLPPDGADPVHGMVMTDASGAVLLAKSVPGFSPARSDTCPLWPVFTALGQLGRPVTAYLTMPGQTAQHLICHAVAEAAPNPDGAHMPPVVRSTMVLRAAPGDPGPLSTAAGISCRVCTRLGCAARREPAAASLSGTGRASL